MPSSPPPKPAQPYWERPIRNQQGDPTEQAIFLSVGSALSTWVNVEEWFSGMFTAFLGLQNFSAGARVFGLINGVPMRVEALDVVSGEAFFWKGVPPEERSAWKLLTEHYKAASGLRNDIAHGHLSRYEDQGIDRGFFLVPVSSNPRRVDPMWEAVETPDPFGFKYWYTSENIKEIEFKFRTLSGWVFQYFVDYTKKYPIQP